MLQVESQLLVRLVAQFRRDVSDLDLLPGTTFDAVGDFVRSIYSARSFRTRDFNKVLSYDLRIGTVWFARIRPRSLLKYPNLCADRSANRTVRLSYLSFRWAPDGHGAEGRVGGFMRSAPAVSGYESG